MDIEFRKIDIESHYAKCYEFRKDSHFCSFGTTEGYSKSIGNYRERIIERMSTNEWFYFHVWHNKQIVGQIEYKSFSFKPNYGYVPLIYVVPEYRGFGIADKVEEHIQSTLQNVGCTGTMLSVSRKNLRAVNHFKSGAGNILRQILNMS
jgi:ribosomal protein S18 acetylase RimI-like enzyme